ncbi:c-type cytochrome [Hansschlegelia plantiphila]|nr:c-type cytochrome [Hansschlegelia plantiphila]
MTGLIRNIAAAAALVLAFAPVSARADAQSDLVARGEYVTRAADCVACHTVPGGKQFTGGRPFKLPFGVLYSPNLTPDETTGIAGYSDDDWVRMLHEGVGRGGKHLYPAMPYASYTGMSREDALAVKAYLMSLAPVHAPAPENDIGFPFNQRWGMMFWNLLNNPNKRFEPDPAKSAEYNRGAYLVDTLGHCGECHTPRNLTMGLKNSKKFAGAEQEGWLAYNLTSDPKSGLGGWTDEQLAEYLSTGQTAGRGPASGPMAEAVEHSLSHLKPEDIKAIVTYLRGVPGQPDGPPAAVAGASPGPADPLGERLFAQACAGCHLPNGAGRQSPWAALGGAHTAADPAGTNLVKVLTEGTQLNTRQGLMFMHPFTGAYNDRELAALGNYVRSQFGYQPGAITPEQIAKQREEASPKPSKPST